MPVNLRFYDIYIENKESSKIQNILLNNQNKKYNMRLKQ